MCNEALVTIELQLMATGKDVGKRDMAPVQHESKKCLVLGDYSNGMLEQNIKI
jgi:hypothetical protein